MNRFLRAAAVAAVVVSMAVCVGTAEGVADTGPQQGKELVVLGDSYAANKMIVGHATNECLHGDTSWPVQLSGLMGVAGTKDFENVSCLGASIDSGPITPSGKHVEGRDGYVLVQEAAAAVAAGSFGPRTKLVAIQIGMNDAWPRDSVITLGPALDSCVFDLVRGCDLDAIDQGRIPDYRAVTGQLFADRIRVVVDYVRYYAPQARILLVGYPELFASTQRQLCLNILGIGDYIQPRGRALVEYLDRIQTAQREAARILHIGFVDARALTAGHGLCSADPWINGVLDPRADLTGLPFHPSVRADTVLARAIYSRITPV